MGASAQLQKSIYAAVKTAVAPVAVYDEVTDNLLPPYVSLGETTATHWDNDENFGSEVTMTIHSWSAYRGYLEVKNIMDAVKTALHEQKLSGFGLNVVMVVMEFAEVMVESDGLTRHGVQRFRILMEEL